MNEPRRTADQDHEETESLEREIAELLNESEEAVRQFFERFEAAKPSRTRALPRKAASRPAPSNRRLTPA